MNFAPYRVNVPEGVSNNWSVSRFEVSPYDLENLRNARDGRGTQPGAYTRLDGPGPGSTEPVLWMSDTDAEVRDHWGAIMTIRSQTTRTVLIHGLGLGVVLQQAILADSVKEIDVVEVSADVIGLVGPHYEQMAENASKRLAIHHDDVLERKWPRGMRWDVVWHDIWVTIGPEEAQQMRRLTRSFGGRAKWQGAWAKSEGVKYAPSR